MSAAQPSDSNGSISALASSRALNVDSKCVSTRLKRLPKLVVFDLDSTLWTPEVSDLDGPPFLHKDDAVHDCSGTRLELYPHVKSILVDVHSHDHWQETKIAVASRTITPDWAKECLEKFKLHEEKSMWDVVHHDEIYPGDKQAHFESIRQGTGLEFEDMIFFDNEYRNVASVGELGVHCVYTPEGLTREHWERGLKEFDAKRG